MIRTPDTTEPKRDDGSILPLVLVFSVVLAMVVVALATYASSTLRLGQVAERSSDRLASANGAMDSALEDLERGVGPCLLFGQDYAVTDVVNDMSPEVDCTWVGGRFNVGDVFAVVMTGAGAGRTGPLLNVTNGGTSANAEKVFEGPVYMAKTPGPSTMNFSATLAIKNADLSYSSNDCGSTTPSMPGELTITPVGYGTQCYEEPWNDPEMFGAFLPPEPDVSSFPTAPATGSPDALGCTIWSPGTYTSAPVLANQSYNYFKSGQYYFKNIGNWDISSAFTLFGYPGDTGPSIDGFKPSDTFANNPCREAWANDFDLTGATLYLGGNTQLTVKQNSTVEISGRVTPAGQNIAVQALETKGIPSTIRGDQRIITTGPGSNKQLSIQGLVWAPYAALEFDLISNDAVAALTGGAVVSELSAGASANANNFLIKVATKPANKVLNLTTTANSPDNQGSTSVKSVVTVQRDAGATSYAVNSRRVVGLTPEGPPPAPAASGPCNVNETSMTDDFGTGPWTAEFWNHTSTVGFPSPAGGLFASSATTKVDVDVLGRNLGGGVPTDNSGAAISNIDPDRFAARFTRTIDVSTACTIEMKAGGDDGYRVLIDDVVVPSLTDWSNHTVQYKSAGVPLTAGTHKLVYEFYEYMGSAVYSLEWKS